MSKSQLSVEEVIEMLNRTADGIIASERILSDADRAIGDGDHGLGMQRGMMAAKEKLAEGGIDSVEKAFSTVGMAMMSSMGGASGAIFGTFFRDGGKAVSGSEKLDSASFAAFLKGGLEGVQKRGKAEPGDKTMVDALDPAAAAAEDFCESPLSEVMKKTAAAAEYGKEKTKEMVAKFGRAKSLGEGSLGHPDAGALSMSLIFQLMADYIND